MQRLRVPSLEEQQPRIVTFRLGIFIGKLFLFVLKLIFFSAGYCHLVILIYDLIRERNVLLKRRL